MKRKTFDLIETKADGEPGQFSALASVFGNVDHVGDRVMPGAFKKTLAQWRKSGDPIPVVLSHQWDNPHAHIGIADPRAVIETEKGLLVQGTLDIADNETAKQVHRLMKRRSLKAFSFGYTVPDGGETLNEEDGANELTEVDLVEFGPTLKGANPEAQLEAVKSALDVEAPPPIPTTFTNTVGSDATVTWDATAPVVLTTATTNASSNLDVEEPPAERVEVPVSDELLGDAEQVREYLKNHPDFEVPEGFKVIPLSEFKPTDELPLTGEALEKAIEESDHFQKLIAERVEATLAVEREKVAEKSLTQEEVENVESETPAEPVTPAAKDALKNEIDLLRLEIAVGKPLRR